MATQMPFAAAAAPAGMPPAAALHSAAPVALPLHLPSAANAVRGEAVPRQQPQQTSESAVQAAPAPLIIASAAVAVRRLRRQGRQARKGRIVLRAAPPTTTTAATLEKETENEKGKEATETSAYHWRKFGSDWEVHKFGGASLETAALYQTCGDLLRSEAEAGKQGDRHMPTAAIVSAAGGMTDALVAVVNTAVQDIEEAREKLEAVAARQIGILHELVPDRPDLTDKVVESIQKDRKGVEAMLTAVSSMRGVPPQVLELVAGLGEVWSAQTLMSYLCFAGCEAGWVDARDVLIIPDSGAGGGLGEKGMAMDTIIPFWDDTAERLNAWWTQTFGEVAQGASAPFLVITGFVCSTPSGRPTTLKRSGSDYSATIFAKVLGSSRVTMWKNVDGVYTADPRRVPAAFPIKRMTFDEAMELAYFGGQVLHPSAMVPCIENRIPVLVRNVFNPSHPGTRVYGRGDQRLRWDDQEDDEEDNAFPVKAITSIEKVALVTIAGASFLGTPGVARKMMEALGSCGVNVILASQGSSEHSITVAVDEKDMGLAVGSVEQAFALELASSQECRVSSRGEVSIVAVVGEGMKNRANISGRFFSAMGRAKVNVIAIAQGSSERNISAVIPHEDLSRALRAAHSGFSLADMTIAVGIIGSGKVGTQVMKQIVEFQSSEGRDSRLPAMAEVRGLNMEVRALCDVNKMILSEYGLPHDKIIEGVGCQTVSGGDVYDIGAWQEALKEEGGSLEALLQGTSERNKHEVLDTDLEHLVDFLDTRRIPHKVIIDCTPADEVANLYPLWLKRGLHVISPSKRACSGSLKLFRECCSIVSQGGTGQWKYSSTTGGQVPVISLLHDIVQTGDTFTRIEGILSGTLSYIFNTLGQNPGMKFSEALEMAKQAGLTEPNPFEDLSGQDTARKALIIARELGLDLELEDLSVESLLPAGVDGSHEPSAEVLATMDEKIAGLMEEATKLGEKLRYAATVDVAAEAVHVGVRRFPEDHPFSQACKADIVVSFVTRRNPEDTPLVVRGLGAGAEVTASGVFADLCRLAKTLGS